jgi:hypothetical protein
MHIKQMALMSDGIEDLASSFPRTRVDECEGYFFKREDAHVVDGMAGAKVRLCQAVLELPGSKRGVVMASGRTCSLPVIMSWIGKQRGIPVTIYYPKSKPSAQQSQAVANGAMTVEVYPGYPNVVEAKAKTEAEATGAYYLPPRNSRRLAVELSAFQVANAVECNPQRIVVPVGTGTTLAGIIVGCSRYGWNKPMAGVVVGMNPERHIRQCLGEFAWPTWLSFVPSGTGFKQKAKEHILGGIELDRYYAAKCIPFMQKGDLLWVTGRSVGLPARRQRMKVPEFETLGEEQT